MDGLIRLIYFDSLQCRTQTPPHTKNKTTRTLFLWRDIFFEKGLEKVSAYWLFLFCGGLGPALKWIKLNQIRLSMKRVPWIGIKLKCKVTATLVTSIRQKDWPWDVDDTTWGILKVPPSSSHFSTSIFISIPPHLPPYSRFISPTFFTLLHYIFSEIWCDTEVIF